MTSRPSLLVLGAVILLALLGRASGLIDADLLAPVAGGLVIIVLLLTVTCTKDRSDL